MYRHCLLSLAILATLCAAPAVQAQTFEAHRPPVARAKAVAKAPAKASATTGKKASHSPHQKRCIDRYKSYNSRNDTYVLRGKRVRCKL